jgi:hypothetical protein
MRKGLAAKYLWVVIPAIVALSFHLPTLFCELVQDDDSLVTKHPEIGRPAFIYEVFSRDYGLEFSERVPTGYYRPFFMAINCLIYRVFGPTPLAYHALSLFAFCCVSLLLSLVCWKLCGKNAILALCVGVIYAAHPARTELVSSFSALPDLLLELYAMATVTLLVLSSRSASRRSSHGISLRAILLCLMIGLLGGLTKGSAFAVLAAICGSAILYDLIHRESKGHLALLAVTTMTGLGVALAIAAVAGIQRPSAVYAIRTVFGSGAGRAVTSAALAIRKCLVPGPTVFILWEGVAASLTMRIAVIGLVIALGSLCLFLIIRKKLFLAMVVAWFSAGIANLMMVRALGLPYADRYFALAPAVIGICLGSRWLYHWVRDRLHLESIGRAERRVLCAVVCLYVIVLGAFTFSSSMKCFTRFSYYRFMAKDNPSLHLPRIALAHLMFYELGEFQEGEKYALEAISLSPNVRKVRELGKLLATIRLLENRHNDALKWLNWAEEVVKDDPDIFSLKGITLHSLGDQVGAISNINKALMLDPDCERYRTQLTLVQSP